ncbi:hypothetical protein [Pseudonocardia parietis]|uniref:PASTA domain-containing protein n=1 Tax=Pseudonocardia parietis TaxID=570936 RepID=A0ABS4W0N0_9PSEU|nr:hypothetical protein [Pseudonocardia parietis]MBP2369766.1 hypothetical protein [Pseudonocardia parietis]
MSPSSNWEIQPAASAAALPDLAAAASAGSGGRGGTHSIAGPRLAGPLGTGAWITVEPGTSTSMPVQVQVSKASKVPVMGRPG